MTEINTYLSRDVPGLILYITVVVLLVAKNTVYISSYNLYLSRIILLRVVSETFRSESLGTGLKNLKTP